MNNDRRFGLGATDASKIITGAFGGSYGVWLEKTQGLSAEESEPMRMGLALEPVLWAEAKRRWKRRLHKGTRVFRNGTVLWASLDASLSSRDCTADEPLDFKTSGDASEWGPDGSDVMPEYIWTQIQAQILVCNAQRGHVLLLLGNRGFEFRYYEIQRDQETCECIEKIAADWWQKHIVEGVPPAADDNDHAAASSLLARRQPTPGAIVKWSKEEAKVVDLWRKAKEGKSALDFMEQAAKGKILAAMGDAETAQLPDGRVLTRKVIKRSGYSVAETEYVVLKEE